MNDKHNLQLSDFQGYRTSELIHDPRMNADCLMVVSHREDGEEGSVQQELSTFAMEYSKLSASIIIDVIEGLGLKSMSKEEKYKYSLSGHNHDTLYSKVYVENVLLCTDSRMTCLADITIENNSDISTFQIRTPKIIIPQSDEISFGTLRFVGCRTFRQFQDQMIRYPDGTYNIDVMNDNFDGWVFANGTNFEDLGVQVPMLSNFLKINNGYETEEPTKNVKYRNSVFSHGHSDISCSFYLTGKMDMYKCWIPSSTGCDTVPTIAHNGGTGEPLDVNMTIDCSTFRFNNLKTSTDGIDIETKPNRNLMPVMFFIGKNHLSTLS